VPNADFIQAASDWAHTALVWIGFGTLAGIVAKLIMPGRDPGGPIATLLMGIAGTCLGLGLLSYFTSQRITPISPLGFVIAIGGAALLLFFHRLLGGYFFTEQGAGYGYARYGGYGYRRPYRRHRVPVIYD
jgi:uncharacterized membrane protein YeaQ/YmgE (transglycosylase-associated protein family)